MSRDMESFPDQKNTINSLVMCEDLLEVTSSA